jgi:hypothetical protein
VGARPRIQRREPGDEVERVEGDGPGSVLPVTSQGVDHAPVLGERKALGRDRGTSEIADQALESVPIVGRDHDLGVEREAVEGGAQLARQEERPGIAAAAEALDARRVALREHAPALHRGGVELGEERLLGLWLGFGSITRKPAAAREVAQDALGRRDATSATSRSVSAWAGWKTARVSGLALE